MPYSSSLSFLAFLRPSYHAAPEAVVYAPSRRSPTGERPCPAGLAFTPEIWYTESIKDVIFMLNLTFLAADEAWILSTLADNGRTPRIQIINSLPSECRDRTPRSLCNTDLLLDSMIIRGWLKWLAVDNYLEITASGYAALHAHNAAVARYQEQTEDLRNQTEAARKIAEAAKTSSDELCSQTETLRQLVESAERRAAAAEEIASAAQKSAETAEEIASASQKSAETAECTSKTSSYTSIVSIVLAVLAIVVAVLAWLVPREAVFRFITAMYSAIC